MKLSLGVFFVLDAIELVREGMLMNFLIVVIVWLAIAVLTGLWMLYECKHAPEYYEDE